MDWNEDTGMTVNTILHFEKISTEKSKLESVYLSSSQSLGDLATEEIWSPLFLFPHSIRISLSLSLSLLFSPSDATKNIATGKNNNDFFVLVG